MNKQKGLLREEAEKISANKSVNVPVNIQTFTNKEISNIIHELQIHQIELEMQNDELRETQRALDAQRKRYFDLYDLAPVGYCTLNKHGMIIQANLTLAALLNISHNKLVTQSIVTGYLLFYRKKFSEICQFPSCELSMRKDDGTEFWAHLMASSHKEADSIVEIYLTISDISEYTRLEERLKLKEMIFSQSRQAAMGEMISMIAYQ